MRTRVDNFKQITIFCPPELRVCAFVYRNAGRVYSLLESGYATRETHKICVPNNHINKHSVQRGQNNFRYENLKSNNMTLAAQDIGISACQELNQFPTPKKPE